MYIYWEEISCGHLVKVPDHEQWHLYCGYDKLGYECLYLQIGNEEPYCICDSEYWSQGRPKLASYHVGDYFTAVVRTVFDLVASKDPKYINLTKIQEKLMTSFWEEWKKKGYIENE